MAQMLPNNIFCAALSTIRYASHTVQPIGKSYVTHVSLQLLTQEYIRELERAEREEKERAKEEVRRQERKNRETFKELLAQHR